MKYIFLKISTILLNIFSSVFMLFPITKKITILSRISNTKTLDIEILEQQINKKFPDYKIVILTDKLGKTVKERFLYVLKTPKQIFNIYTSKIVLCDSYIPVVSLIFKKKKVKIIQIWHAMGAYKKFGYSIIDKYEGADKAISKIMKMHKNYDYILTTSNYSKQKFKEAFNYSDDKLKVSILPRYNYLKNNKEKLKKEILQDYKLLNNGKKNVIYAPTFRKSKRNYFDKIIKNINYKKYNLIVKKHGGAELIYIDNKLVYKEYNKYSIKLLAVSDILITDYSSIIFDSMAFDINIFFYIPDYDKYKKERALYDEIFLELGNYYTNIEELLNNLDLQKNLNYNEIKNKYIDKSAIETIDFVIKIIKGEF